MIWLLQNSNLHDQRKGKEVESWWTITPADFFYKLNIREREKDSLKVNKVQTPRDENELLNFYKCHDHSTHTSYTYTCLTYPTVDLIDLYNINVLHI